MGFSYMLFVCKRADRSLDTKQATRYTVDEILSIHIKIRILDIVALTDVVNAYFGHFNTFIPIESSLHCDLGLMMQLISLYFK